MNHNPKERTERLDVRLSRREKRSIQRKAEQCGLPVSEFVRQTLEGYEPRQALPEEFYDAMKRLCKLMSMDKVSPEVNWQALNVLNELQLLAAGVNHSELPEVLQ